MGAWSKRINMHYEILNNKKNVVGIFSVYFLKSQMMLGQHGNVDPWFLKDIEGSADLIHTVGLRD